MRVTAAILCLFKTMPTNLNGVHKTPFWKELAALKKQQEFKVSLDKLTDLPPKKATTKGIQESEPKFPEDPSLNKTEKMASHNYWMIVKDETLGVHNPVYLKNLLENSIESLEK